MLFGTCTIYNMMKNTFEFSGLYMTNKFIKYKINVDIKVFKINITYPDNSNNIP